jgi:hypothetical protein
MPAEFLDDPRHIYGLPANVPFFFQDLIYVVIDEFVDIDDPV